MVAAILLMHRKGITEDTLVEKVQWLSEELLLRGSKIGALSNYSGANVAVRNSINLLENVIIKNKKNVFQMSLQAKQDYINILMLSYYRNCLVHVFFSEAICTCALYSFGL